MYWIFIALILISGLTVKAKTCNDQALKKVARTFKELDSLKKIKANRGAARFSYHTFLYRCRLDTLRLGLFGANWSKVCAAKSSRNRSSCLRHWLVQNPVGSSADIQELVSMIRKVAIKDRRDFLKSGKKIIYPDSIAVQELQNLTTIVGSMDIGKFYFQNLDTADSKASMVVSREKRQLIKIHRKLLSDISAKLAAYHQQLAKKPKKKSKQKSRIYTEQGKKWLSTTLDKVEEVIKRPEVKRLEL